MYWLTAGIIGPHIGAIIGAWTYKLTIWQNSVDRNNDERTHSFSYKLTTICSEDNDKKENDNSFTHKKNRKVNKFVNESENTRPLMKTIIDGSDASNQITSIENSKINTNGLNSDGIDDKSIIEINNSSIAIYSSNERPVQQILPKNSLSSLNSLSEC